jgi:hypothetical protein
MTVKTLTAAEYAAHLHIGIKEFKNVDGSLDATRIALRTSTGNQGLLAYAALLQVTKLVPLTILGYAHAPDGSVVGNAYRWLFFDKAQFDAAKGDVDVVEPAEPAPELLKSASTSDTSVDAEKFIENVIAHEKLPAEQCYKLALAFLKDEGMTVAFGEFLSETFNEEEEEEEEDKDSEEEGEMHDALIDKDEEDEGPGEEDENPEN